jgi:hypothetical protein
MARQDDDWCTASCENFLASMEHSPRGILPTQLFFRDPCQRVETEPVPGQYPPMPVYQKARDHTLLCSSVSSSSECCPIIA